MLLCALLFSSNRLYFLRRLHRNYKSPLFSEAIAEAAKPSYVDCYFDNVGGAILNTCLPLIKRNGCIAACGAISGYNDPSQTVLSNWSEIIINRITVQGERTHISTPVRSHTLPVTVGFIVMDYYHRRGEGIQVISSAIKEGKLSVAGGETVVRTGFEKVPEVWMRLFRGENTGKLVTQIADL